MAVERDRWYGSPIAEDGTVRRDRAQLWPRLLGLLDDLGWGSLRRWAPVLVVANRPEQRRAAARDTLGDSVPCFSQILPIDHRLTRLPHPDHDRLARWSAGVVDALATSGVAFARATSSALPDLTRYALVVVPVLSCIEVDAWRALERAAATGVIVVAGPGAPRLDERLQPWTPDPGGILHVHDPAEIAAHLPPARVRCAHAEVDVERWVGEGREIVVAWNRSAQPVDACLEIGRRASLRGRWTPETLDADGSVGISLPPYGVQVWELLEAPR
jgi:beta-galactosidase